MESIFQDAIGLVKEIALKINPIIDWIAVQIANFIDVESQNVHLILVVLLAYWAAGLVDDETFSIKRVIAAGILFAIFKYIGM